MNSRQQCDAIREEFERLSNELMIFQDKIELQNQQLVEAASSMDKLVHEKEEIEEKLRQRSRLESLGMLIGGVAHNFNNALSIVGGNLQILKRKLKDEEQLLKYVDNASGGVTAAAELIQQLLSYSKAPAVHPLPFSLYDNIFKTCKLIRSSTPASFHVEVYKIDEDNNYGIVGYPSQIQEIILNLTSNAAQATHNTGSITFTLDTVDVKPEDIPKEFKKCVPGDYVRILATDDGPGIPKDIIDKIFDPFFTTKKKGEGTGIGLATVKKIIDRHHGMIFVNANQYGTTFELYFPVSFRQSTKVDDEQSEQPKKIVDEAHHADYNILIVDDEEPVMNVLRTIVEDFGFHTDAVSKPKQAMMKIIDDPEHYNLILTDYAMPGMHGLDLIKNLHAVNSDLKSIIISGTFHEEIDDEFKEHYHIVDVLNKPVDSDTLLSKIQTAVGL